MTAVDFDCIKHSIEYEPKQILISGSDSMCLGEILQL